MSTGALDATVTSIPLGSSPGRRDLRERLALLAKLLLTQLAFLYLAGTIHRTIFLGASFLPVTTILHLTVTLFQGFALWVVTQTKPSARVLEALEAAMVLFTLIVATVQARLVAAHFSFSVDLVVVLITFCILTARAAIVPSTTRRSLVIGLLGIVPATGFALWFGAQRGRAIEGATFALIWLAACVGVTTFTSRVIYGLRQSAALAKELGPYVLEHKIGEGGMGAVFLARHRLLRRPTAIKLLPPERAGFDTITRFEREVQETSRLSHPNTVSIYDYGRTEGGVFYYAMEYLEGADLEALVARHGRMPAARVVHVLAQIAGALAEAHGRGLVHRDMKPANVILCERGGLKDTAKVVDFGLVKATEPGDPLRTDVSAIIGTPAYLSPEAIVSPDRVDARSDIYAVGAIGYWLLTGQRVFDESSVMAMCAAHLHQEPIAPSKRMRRKPPPALEALILACLAKDPAARPQSAAALLAALRDVSVPTWTTEDADAWWSTHPLAA